MEKPVCSHNMSTYTKIILSHCQWIADLITTHSLPVKAKVQVVEEEAQPANYIHLLTDEQLNDAMSGPYQDFFRVIFIAYGTIVRIRHAHVTLNDEVLKQAIECDEAELRKLSKVSIAEVAKLENKLHELITNLDQLLCELVASETQVLSEMLRAAALKFKENDFIEFQSEYPTSELNARLVDLMIDNPQRKSDRLDFFNYFYLKLYIAVYSSLSVEHKAHDFKSIQPELDQFIPTLKQYKVKLDQWHSEMQAQVDDLMQPIAFAKNMDIK